MKYITILALMLSPGSIVHAQNKNLSGGKYAVKLYNTASWLEHKEPFNSGIFTGNTTTEEFRYLHPSVAVSVRNAHGNFHELELSDLQFTRHNEESSLTGIPVALSGSEVKTVNIALRYEYIINFLKKKNTRFMPALGLAAMPYFERTSSSPVLSTEFPVSQLYAGVRAFITPRLTYAVSQRFFVDLNIPFCVADMYLDKSVQNNPMLTQEQQREEVFTFEAAPRLYSIRIGAGIRL